MPVKFSRRCQVRLGDDRHVRSVEDGGILERFIFAFGDGHEHQAEILTEVVGGRANQITDVLDKKEIQMIEVPSL